jgi:hypothetical protein
MASWASTVAPCSMNFRNRIFRGLAGRSGTSDRHAVRNRHSGTPIQ